MACACYADYSTEQKRRQAIRDGFDKLCELVPGLEGQGRSEGLVLGRTVEYMREQLEVRRKLVQEREARGEVVDEKFKEYVPFSPHQLARLVSLTDPYRPLKILERLEELDRIRGPKQEDDDY